MFQLHIEASHLYGDELPCRVEVLLVDVRGYWLSHSMNRGEQVIENLDCKIRKELGGTAMSYSNVFNSEAICLP